MTIFTHLSVGLGLSSFFPGRYLLHTLLFSILPDVDHVWEWLRSAGRRRRNPDRRSLAHELAGTLMWLLIAALVFLLNAQIGSIFLVCISAHLFLDFVSDYSQPYRRLRQATSIDFRLSRRTRLLQELSTALLFLWIFWTQ